MNLMIKMMKIKRKKREGEEDNEKQLGVVGTLLHTMDLQSNG
jgi:hypothetical protein